MAQCSSPSAAAGEAFTVCLFPVVIRISTTVIIDFTTKKTLVEVGGKNLLHFFT
jgi:hypothetical protein